MRFTGTIGEGGTSCPDQGTLTRAVDPRFLTDEGEGTRLHYGNYLKIP